MRTKSGRKLVPGQCSVCGCAVPMLSLREFGDGRDGWHSGHLTVATGRGFEVLDIRCPSHIPGERATAGSWPTSAWPVVVE